MNQALSTTPRLVAAGAGTSVIVAVVISITLHAVLALVMLQVPSGWLAETRDDESVFFELIEEPAQEVVALPVAPVEPEPLEPEPLEPEPLEPEPLEPETLEPETLPDPTQVAAMVPDLPNVPGTADGNDIPNGSGVAANVEAPSALAPAASGAALNPRSRAMQLLLDPTRVAQGGFVATGPGPSRPSGPAGLGSGPRGRSEAEIERDLAGGLRRQAMAKAHITREPVRLVRQSDGSHSWAGPMFTARVAPDGEVTFEDGADVGTNGFSSSGTFDLQGAIMGAQGQDPRSAERERFMRETRVEREAIEDAWHRRLQAREVRRLRGELRSVWSRPGRSAASRRARIFVLWDRITEDGSMNQVRAALIAFVRENLPEGSEDAYTAAELSSLNARRDSREPFAPY